MILVTDPQTLHVMQGQARLSEGPDDVLAALLGSCVAACLWDPVLKLGGMNHFLLPGSGPASGQNTRYGLHSMEELVNGLLRKGAARNRLNVALFGGADTLDGRTKVGASNAAFAREFVETEGFQLIQSDLGGKKGRQLRFHPFSGDFEMKYIANAPAAVAQKRPASEIELF